MRGTWIVGMGLALLGLLAAVPVPAQELQRGDLGGQLFREDGQTPIAEATMVVRHTATGAVFQDKTDDRGRFLVHNVPPGDYEVRATVQGILYTYTATVRVVPKALVRICLALVPPYQALRPLEDCKTDFPPFWLRYGRCLIIGGVAVAAATGVVVALPRKEEVTPPRP
jgi:hypothetical protein